MKMEEPANGYPPNPGTAYPYQNHDLYYAPPPQPSPVPIRRLFTVFLIILCLILGPILFISAILLLLIHYRPQSPDVYLNSLSVSNFTVSDDHLAGKWDLGLQFQNPNFTVSGVLCTLRYNRATLSHTRLQPFDQGTKDQTPMNATLSVSGTYVDGRLVDSIRIERETRGSVEFDLRLVSLVTFPRGLVYPRKSYVTVFCDDVAVGVGGNSSSGNMVGSAKRCKHAEYRRRYESAYLD